ncbi:hypothetical protein B0J13DRAFT_526466 [Dactylonectria estremocensis]|uniref:Uncharacterized protein n=1 Tax=Dactylonectria estremocensis TaxID=1079267 RepID=A0A9P9EPY8_9HYPO|nr:hypothetical protein B0J13DRAFT_526466 [Dactylonectria estremocensis]
MSPNHPSVSNSVVSQQTRAIVSKPSAAVNDSPVTADNKRRDTRRDRERRGCGCHEAMCFRGEWVLWSMEDRRVLSDGQTARARYRTLLSCPFALRKLGYARLRLRPDRALLPSVPELSYFLSSYIHVHRDLSWSLGLSRNDGISLAPSPSVADGPLLVPARDTGENPRETPALSARNQWVNPGHQASSTVLWGNQKRLIEGMGDPVRSRHRATWSEAGWLVGGAKPRIPDPSPLSGYPRKPRGREWI